MQIAFDGNGRMFVLEIRGYMQDADATGELAPTGRISVHEDTDNDGVYEKHTVFVDKMVFPRFVMPFGANAILTMESNADEVWKYTDTNGDGVADKKELFTTGFGRAGNIEHQQSSLIWGMDNWMYTTFNAFRVRGRRTASCGNRPAPTARSGASPRTTTARSGSRAARAGCPATSSSRSTTASSRPRGGGNQQFLEPDSRSPGASPASATSAGDGRDPSRRAHAPPRDRRGRQRRLPRRPPAPTISRRLSLRRAGRPHRAPRQAGRH